MRALMLTLFTLSLLQAACSGGASTATTVVSSPTPTGPMTVSLREWAIDVSTPVTKAGIVKLAIRNDGSVPHDLVVVKSDLAPNRLPTASGRVELSQVTTVTQTALLPPGDRAEASFTVERGRYIVLCNVIGHYNSGQFTSFTVE